MTQGTAQSGDPGVENLFVGAYKFIVHRPPVIGGTRCRQRVLQWIGMDDKPIAPSRPADPHYHIQRQLDVGIPLREIPH